VHDHRVDDELLPIGMFSRASSLSIKTLRAYHESGILVPARVDPQTGYRSYTVDQLGDAAIVQRLRALDLPLEQVRAIVEARDPETTRRVLAAHEREMRLRLEETERIVAELQSVAAPITHTPVHLRTEAATQSVRITGSVSPDEFGDWLAWAYGELGAFLDRHGVARSGPPGALYAAELVDDGPEAAEAFLPITEPVVVPSRERHVTIGEVPAARVAVLVHAGDYDTIGDTYRTLGAWVARHAQHAGERVREWYVIGPPDCTDVAEYRTEISWPIRPTRSTNGGASS
jgi:DNA-binding transcriptional MerR regulator